MAIIGTLAALAIGCTAAGRGGQRRADDRIDMIVLDHPLRDVDRGLASAASSRMI